MADTSTLSLSERVGKGIMLVVEELLLLLLEPVLVWVDVAGSFAGECGIGIAGSPRGIVQQRPDDVE